MTIKSNFVIIGIALLIIETCFFNYSQAQNLAYKKYIYKWDDAIPPKMEISKQFLHEDAVILSEDNNISISNNIATPTFIDFQKKTRIKFLTKEGISKYSKITLPESYDYSYDYRDVALKNREIKNRPAYLNVNVIYFAARIIKADGRITTAIVNDSIIKEKIHIKRINNDISKNIFNFEHYAFYIKNLELGDELEFDYKISVPYNDNWIKFNTARIFFNGNLPKLKYSLTINYHPKLDIDIKYLNNAKPDSIKTIDNTKSLYWHFDNLYGCMDEQGSRPYISLPYIDYLLNTQRFEYLYTKDHVYTPYWVIDAQWNEEYYLTLYKETVNGVNTGQTILVRKFINELCQEIPDSLNFIKFKKIHHEIVNNFKYQDDYNYYTGEDIRDERRGEFVSKKILRDISRYRLYPEIFANLKSIPFSVYMLDKRFGEINVDYVMPIWDIDNLFIVLFNDYPLYLYPKKSDFGYYLDELPFYWENATGLFINPSDFWEKYPIPFKFKTITTPYSLATNNIRINNIKVDINLDSLTTNFDAKVSLSGQFSTMNRGCYLYDNYRDSSVNDLYSKRIWDINQNIKLLKKEIISKKDSSPFAFSIRANFVSNQLIIKNVTEQTYTLDIKNWFNHIIYNNFNTTNRYLDFYPDFLGQDVYRYYITFDKDIELIEKVKDVELDNSLGKLSIKISQLKPNVIMLESNFIVINDKVPYDKINDVAEIYSNINKLNYSQITFKALQK